MRSAAVFQGENRRQSALGMGFQQLIGNAAKARKQARNESVPTHAADRAVLFDACENGAEQLLARKPFRAFAGGYRKVDEFPGAHVAMAGTMVQSDTQLPGRCGGQAKRASRRFVF